MAEHTIKSPYPGTFYRRPNPEADPYVAEGDEVSSGDVVGLVEIMKNFHEIKAETDGHVERFLVENEAAVEAGQEIVALRV
ncbi:MAG TPA: acetyl-CoA carboxylase [Thermoleophilaceae bacterium]|jgi:biotin carboxyl carrier protein|nr:acetyl-CoA carboxylase [Thermoleophilaceae bacterium]